MCPSSTIETSCHELKFFPSVSSDCTFPASIFLEVMHNLIRNPNITSSHLFRGDILYDSEKDPTYNQAATSDLEICGLSRYMQSHLRPRLLRVAGFVLSRTIVRRLIPRNPRLDKPLIQTCHLYQAIDATKDRPLSQLHGMNEAELSDDKVSWRTTERLVIYLPHAHEADIPWYHPKLKAIAFAYTNRSKDGRLHHDGSTPSSIVTEKSDAAGASPSGTISLHIANFHSALPRLEAISHESSSVDSSRLDRMLQRLLQTIVHHGQGRLQGYVKQVQHDVVVHQARFQEAYTRLKLKYAMDAVSGWNEKTDPTKHVFEDLGIAAFLIELWQTMYRSINDAGPGHLPNFPGFVDMGCGNGFLVHLLISEGYHGQGFDARTRKSWDSYPSSTRRCLQEAILIPQVLSRTQPRSYSADCGRASSDALSMGIDGKASHDSTEAPGPFLGGEVTEGSEFSVPDVIDGTFAAGTFIVSNHADELTPWTPLLARWSGACPFLAIPCCSHDLSGARTRFSVRAAAGIESGTSPRTQLPISQLQLSVDPMDIEKSSPQEDMDLYAVGFQQDVNTAPCVLAPWEDAPVARAPLRVALRKPPRPPSAYSTLCDYTERLSQDLGYVTKREVLRIPSTRNIGILGMYEPGNNGSAQMDTSQDDASASQASVLRSLTKEMPRHSIEDLSNIWWTRMEKIRRTSGPEH